MLPLVRMLTRQHILDLLSTIGELEPPKCVYFSAVGAGRDPQNPKDVVHYCQVRNFLSLHEPIMNHFEMVCAMVHSESLRLSCISLARCAYVHKTSWHWKVSNSSKCLAAHDPLSHELVTLSHRTSARCQAYFD